MASAQAYCRPSDNVAPLATWSLVAGTAVTGYGPALVADLNPAKAFKATGDFATLRATFGGPVVLKGIGIANHNLAGAASTVVSSGSGLSQPVAIAPNSGGQNTPSILDFSAASLSQRTSTTFDFAVTGNVLGNVAIGEIFLLVEIRDLRWIYGLKIRPKRLVVRAGTTFGGTHLQYNKRIRVHIASGKVELKTEEAAMRLLEDEAQGEVHLWVLWPDRAVNHFYPVKFVPGTFEWLLRSFGSTEIPIEAEEMSQGPPLFP